MPTYDYECKGCGHEFQKEQRITENPAKKCPACGAMKAKRLISRTNFVLKGSGWYNDLYASSGGKAKDGDAESKAPESTSTSEGTAKSGADETKKSAKGSTKSSDSSKPTKSSDSSKKKGQAAA